MLKLSLRVERVVTPEEVTAISAFVRQLKSVDVFKLELVPDEEAPQEIEETAAEQEAPVAPSDPVIVPARRKKRRPWDRRMADAFNMALVKMPGSRNAVEDLRQEFVWEVKEINEWKEFPVSELPNVISVLDEAEGFHIVKAVLRELGREPAKRDTVLLPPRRTDWEARKAAEDKERQEANLKLTGDPHIGVEGPLPGEATLNDYAIETLLDGLDWEGDSYKVMSMREFFAWANLKYNHGNAIKMGKAISRRKTLDIDHRTINGIFFRFPVPKDFMPPYPCE